MEINEFSWKEVSLYHFRHYSIVKPLTYKDLAKWYFSEVFTEKYHKSIILNTEVSSLPNYPHTTSTVSFTPRAAKPGISMSCFIQRTLWFLFWASTGTFGALMLPKWGTVLAQVGHCACPSWARCLPRMGTIAVRRMPNKLAWVRRIRIRLIVYL